MAFAEVVKDRTEKCVDQRAFDGPKLPSSAKFSTLSVKPCARLSVPSRHVRSTPLVRFGFGRAKRQGMARMNGNPGPGAYQPASVREGSDSSASVQRKA